MVTGTQLQAKIQQLIIASTLYSQVLWLCFYFNTSSVIKAGVVISLIFQAGQVSQALVVITDRISQLVSSVPGIEFLQVSTRLLVPTS